nr:uncharacterized protein LOC109189671 [Ipomoea batatas]
MATLAFVDLADDYSVRQIGNVLVRFVGPWTYEKNLLILQHISLDKDPELVVLDRAEFWI